MSDTSRLQIDAQRAFGHQRLETAEQAKLRKLERTLKLTLALVVLLVAFLAGYFLRSFAGGFPSPSAASSSAQPLIKRIAFGSCTSKGVNDERAQPIWTAVIASEPDAWVWLGDFAYLDYPDVRCESVPQDTQCHCAGEENMFKIEPHCVTGDVNHSLGKYRTQLGNPDYSQFLEYMCPGTKATGLLPPPGGDPDLCPKPVIGTYDDHDYGWDNGDGRFPRKWEFKNMFLDALGVPATSHRRNMHRGLWDRHVFNEGTAAEIEVYLLDERYDRVPKPCRVRREWCEMVLGAPANGTDGSTHASRGWCRDFLQGGRIGEGSCCKFDEAIQLGWCKEEGNESSELWETACDHTSPLYGMTAVVLDQETGVLREPDGTETFNINQDSAFCEVLGSEQRYWLHKSLQESTAALRIIASGSVLIAEPGEVHDCDGVPCACSGDDFSCYQFAQRNLLSMIDQAPGCTVVLTGDYHFSDIKSLQPGEQPGYSDWFASASFRRSIPQVMASGLTSSTAIPGTSCSSYRLDPAGLRDHAECDIVLDPNFGNAMTDK
ncbi:unnamed protein product [Chrysoparadoxa australica]